RSARAAARFASDPVDRSSTTSTSWPSASRRSTRGDPMNPAPPVTSARIASFLVDGQAVAGASARVGLLDAVAVRAGRHDLVVADHGEAAEDRAGADA